ncbi:hypothetical protein BASA50_004423 [Batrachochytrium salamandrivorans]|uniref:Uncharacterized protein n=1 Tax=Batrachochytrium salamandrivorans TaxID=1357716 RepID=A0ABQ8FIN0_9FUNG|nr:hypothetical protein BASA50_004423 [Batrachochytrium salamandrivorans]
MKVDTGIILSVLSFSVLAAVIPNDDDHGTLLARRTVDPDTMDLLWKRADGDQMQVVPSGLGAGASTSNPGGFGSNNLLAGTGGPPQSSGGIMSTSRQRAKQRSNERYVQQVITKLNKVVEGRNKNAFITEITSFLRTTMDVASRTPKLYSNQLTAPFSVTVPQGGDQSLIKTMINIQSTGKRATKGHLGTVLRIVFFSIIRSPKTVILKLERIKNSALSMYKKHQFLYNRDYMGLMSRAGHANNEGHIKKTQAFISTIKNYQERLSASLDSIKREASNGGITFKEKAKKGKPSRFGRH